ncbi:MAG: YigZ family protein [Gemmatimonadaceae bacterium]|nr:YigZ family protein [Gemmatimonadaceae bacterium]
MAERPHVSPRYAIPAATHRTEQVIDRSRFICTIASAPTVEAAQQFIRAIGQEYADATHNCWAFVIGAPGSTDRIGLSDDGEPHGTAGRPMLTVLQHCGLGDIVAVVTRYYGGTKLGTGGLVKAYGGAVQCGLETLPRGMRITRVDVIARVGYPVVSALHQLLPQFEAETVTEEFGVDVRVHVRCPEEQADALRRALMDATRGLVHFESAVQVE